MRIKSVVVKAMQQSNLSVLDYIMGVEKMSERDRAWYDLYKSYGNRNHTWQDFRDMFNDDIVLACKTLQGWKTWEQINYLKRQEGALYMQVRCLLEKYNKQSIDRDDYQSVYKKYPDLVATYSSFLTVFYNAMPNYCTFNANVANIKRKYWDVKLKNPKPSARYIMEMDRFVDLRNAKFVIGERIENYCKIILNNADIMQKIQSRNLSKNKKIRIARNILMASADIHGAYHGEVALDKLDCGSFSPGSNKITFNKELMGTHSLFDMLSTLIHEDNHKIDYTNSDFGLLGSQIMEYEQSLYRHKKRKIYYKDPAEQSSYFVDEIVSLAIKMAIGQKQR